MKPVISFLIIVGSSILLAACEPLPPLLPGAEQVLITTKPAPAKGCRFIKTLTGNYGSIVVGQFINTHELTAGSLRRMRNAAKLAGANWVQLKTKQGQISGGFNYSMVNRVMIVGKAYHCIDYKKH